MSPDDILGRVRRPFRQVDVFSSVRHGGNPVAVVLAGAGLSTEAMQGFANWMNLSETTFVLPPTVTGADYRVRIFTPSAELPFAGHPTLGTCHAWLSAGGEGRQRDVIVQECAAGLIPLRRTADGLAFAAPPAQRRCAQGVAHPRARTAAPGARHGPTTGLAGWPSCWPA